MYSYHHCPRLCHDGVRPGFSVTCVTSSQLYQQWKNTCLFVGVFVVFCSIVQQNMHEVKKKETKLQQQEALRSGQALTNIRQQHRRRKTQPQNISSTWRKKTCS